MAAEPFLPDENLPPYLRETEPLELEDLPLQVALLTMEVAALRTMLMRLSSTLDAIATRIGNLPG